MTDQRSVEGEMDQFVAQLEAAGSLEVSVDAEGREAYRLTEQGVRIGRILALAGDGDSAVLDALLGADG